MTFIQIIGPILILAGLTAGWVAVQLLARKMGTKNHIDNAGACGNGCTCMSAGESCTRQKN